MVFSKKTDKKSVKTRCDTHCTTAKPTMKYYD